MIAHGEAALVATTGAVAAPQLRSRHTSTASAAQRPERDKIKLVVVGDGAVGKTSMLFCLTKGEAPTEYIPTVFDNYERDVVVDDRPAFLSCWDTAGQEEFSHIRPLSYPDTSVFVVCCSVDNYASFENIRLLWLPELAQHAKDVPVIIVGTKCDLRHVESVVRERAAVGKPMRSPEDAKTLALGLGAKVYIECSAKSKINIQRVFDEAVRVARVSTAEKAALRAAQKEQAQAHKAARRASIKSIAGASSHVASGGGCCSVQ